MQTCALAVDIGASSGRHIVGTVENGRMALHEVYRFENRLVEKNGHLCWDLEALWNSVLEGLRACKAAGYAPATMGIDTWAVDFVLLDGQGQIIGDTVAYRDGRTAGIREALEPALPFAEHYARTGIQYQPFNTAYQLAALKNEHPDQLAAAKTFLMVPDYLNFKLTGVAANEYTNASTTALVGAESQDWDDEIISKLGLPREIFQPIRMPGQALGPFTAEIRDAVGFDCTVLLPATHDTGSAFLAVPARDDKAVYLSSGTWSLLGVENPQPITTPESCAANFTNEGGYESRYRYLKNIMGLWIVQCLQKQLGISFGEMVDLARTSRYEGTFDVNEARFSAPADMKAEIAAALAEQGTPPAGDADLILSVYRSLAAGYGQAVRQLEELTGRRWDKLYIAGGGAKNALLNQLTAQATGKRVIALPIEATAIGNLKLQMQQEV